MQRLDELLPPTPTPSQNFSFQETDFLIDRFGNPMKTIAQL